MSTQTVNLSSNDVVEHLNFTLPSGWTYEAGELDVVCVNSPEYEIGYIVTLNIDSFKGYSFSVYEIIDAIYEDKHNESNNDFLTYDEVLNFIRTKVEAYTA